MENGTKLRLLYIYQYLLEHTDPDHPQSTVELIRMLKEKYDLKVSRNTISDDLILLRNSELHISYIPSTQNKYYYDGQPFEVSELKILMDAICSAKFITEGISQQLVSKLLTLTTQENAQQLRRHITLEGTAKSDSRSGYYSVDVINTAIDIGRKITFRYTDFDVNKHRYLTNDGSFYTLSPYELIWDGNYYYVRGYCDERETMRNFRLDRLEGQPTLLNDAAVPVPEGYDPAEYKKVVFRMMDTDVPKEVELFCHVSVMKYIIDNFGSDVKTEAVDEEHFKATVNVCTSSTFYRWVFGFCKKIRILGPEKVLQEYKDMLRDAEAAAENN